MTRRDQLSPLRLDGDPANAPARRRGWRPLTADGGDSPSGCAKCGKRVGMASNADAIRVLCNECQGVR